MKRYFWKQLDAAAQSALLGRPALEDDGGGLQATVAEIIDQVRRGGDDALRALTERFEGASLEHFAVGESEFADAQRKLSAEQREAIRAAAANIEAFHRAQLPSDIVVETAGGVRCERLTRPIQRVGLYVPAANAPLPSTALMLGIPARLAGCPTRILCTTPNARGEADPSVLFAAAVCGIDRVFKLGGAQAIAAMAYGTASVPKVDKIFGPGSKWVTAAKTQVAYDPLGAALDLPAGPSEVMVVADEHANAAFVASDLLSQAEHGIDSQALLVTTSAALAESVAQEIEAQTARLRRRHIIEQALEHSAAVIVEDIETALAVANRYAPEHLILQIEEPRRWLPAVQAAGSVFLGPWAPESIGDYCSGTNHVLPTYGFARAYSGLGVSDFLRSMTVQELSAEGLARIGPVAETLAGLEGLDAHAAAVGVRLAALPARSTQ